jgi:hypothetical protein
MAIVFLGLLVSTWSIKIVTDQSSIYLYCQDVLIFNSVVYREMGKYNVQQASFELKIAEDPMPIKELCRPCSSNIS